MKQGIYFLRRRNEKFKSDLILPQGGGGGGGGRGDEGRRGRGGKEKEEGEEEIESISIFPLWS